MGAFSRRGRKRFVDLVMSSLVLSSSLYLFYYQQFYRLIFFKINISIFIVFIKYYFITLYLFFDTHQQKNSTPTSPLQTPLQQFVLNPLPLLLLLQNQSVCLLSFLCFTLIIINLLQSFMILFIYIPAKVS